MSQDAKLTDPLDKAALRRRMPSIADATIIAGLVQCPDRFGHELKWFNHGQDLFSRPDNNDGAGDESELTNVGPPGFL